MITLRFSAKINDEHEKDLEVIKSLMMTSPDSGIDNDSTLEEVFYECSNIGLAVLKNQMIEEGIYEKYLNQVELGNEVDDLLNGAE